MESSFNINEAVFKKFMKDMMSHVKEYVFEPAENQSLHLKTGRQSWIEVDYLKVAEKPVTTATVVQQDPPSVVATVVQQDPPPVVATVVEEKKDVSELSVLNPGLESKNI